MKACGSPATRSPPTWTETPQYRQAVMQRAAQQRHRPDSGVTRNRPASRPGAQCPVSRRLRRGTCQQVPGGLDIGSLQGQAGAYTNPNSVGGGLDGVPDIEFAQMSVPGTTSGNQYNGRVWISTSPTTTPWR